LNSGVGEQVDQFRLTWFDVVTEIEKEFNWLVGGERYLIKPSSANAIGPVLIFLDLLIRDAGNLTQLHLAQLCHFSGETNTLTNESVDVGGSTSGHKTIPVLLP